MVYISPQDIKLYVCTESKYFGIKSDGTLTAYRDNALIKPLPYKYDGSAWVFESSYVDGCRMATLTGVTLTTEYTDDTKTLLDQKTPLLFPIRPHARVEITRVKDKGLGYDAIFANARLGIQHVSTSESITGGTTSDPVTSVTLSNKPIAPSTVSGVVILDNTTDHSAHTCSDDGNGNLVEGGTVYGTINYDTGVMEINSDNATTFDDCTVSYTYGSIWSGGNLLDYPEANFRVVILMGNEYAYFHHMYFAEFNTAPDPESAATETITFDGANFNVTSTDSTAFAVITSIE